MDLRIDRRTLLKLAGAATALSAPGLATIARAAQTQVSWLTWENLAKDSYLAAFKAKTGIDIAKNFIGTDDEQFAKLRAAAPSVDLITWASTKSNSMSGRTSAADQHGEGAEFSQAL